MADIRAIVFTRGDQSFTFGLTPPYQLHPDTLLPSAQALDSSGIEYMGRNGGMGLAARVQRQTVDITFNVVARDPKVSYTQLLSDANMFFRPMNSDLSVTRFDMTVTMCDGVQWMMRRGHVSVPFSAPATRLLGIGVQGKLGLIFDDPNRYWVSGAGVVSGDITPSGDPSTLVGEQWQGGLQMFMGGKSQWFMPSAGAAGIPQSVTISSAYPVPVSFKIYGQITHPKLVNITNGDTWSWPGTLKSGEVLSVDEDGVMLDQHGIRRFNASGGLKAEPGVNTFALYGENVSHPVSTAWTGTPNASTSTLPQDGAVMATNLFTNPVPLASALSTKGVVATDTSNGVSIVATNDMQDSYATISTIPVNANTTYHIAAELMQLDGPTWPNGPLFAVEWTATNALAATHVAIGGRKQAILQTDFTTKPTATHIDIRLYAPLDKTQQTVWRHIGLYAASDWAAMQALGVDWFSGDTVSPEVAPRVDAYANVMIRGAF